jgi:hypothetical protein
MSNDRRIETTLCAADNEASKGAQKLHISITRMKKLKSAVKGGPVSTASTVWGLVSIRRSRRGSARQRRRAQGQRSGAGPSAHENAERPRLARYPAGARP